MTDLVPRRERVRAAHGRTFFRPKEDGRQSYRGRHIRRICTRIYALRSTRSTCEPRRKQGRRGAKVPSSELFPLITRSPPTLLQPLNARLDIDVFLFPFTAGLDPLTSTPGLPSQGLGARPSATPTVAPRHSHSSP